MNRTPIEELKSKFNLTGIPRPAVVGLVAVMVVIVCVAIGKVFVGAPKERVVLEPSVTSAHAQEAEDDTQPQNIFVHVSGAVQNPGLVELEASARVANAVERAGGFTAEADTTSINLARVLSDGEQLFIATQQGNATTGEELAGNGQLESGVNVGASTNSGAASAAQQSSRDAVGGKVNINTATHSQLTALPGIGDSTATKIINDRTKNGPFKKIEDITRVSGIGDKKLEALQDLICV